MNRSALARIVPAALTAVGVAGAAICTLNFPAVKGLGTKVRLPVFHGALTWVNLAAFSVMGLLALVFILSGRSNVWRWEAAVRSVAVPAWLAGTVLGLLAALGTWDFTGSKASPLSVAAADPRLMAQFWTLLAALVLLTLVLLLDSPRIRAVADLGFVVFLWAVIMRAVLGPGRALHPDSPVLNSDEILIKVLFFGIVISLGVAFVGAVMLVERWFAKRDAARGV
jgi:hypothetical protein